MNPFPWLWLVWGLLGALLEIAAFATRRKGDIDRVDTLSRSLQWLFVERRSAVRRASLAGWFIFAGWFAYHLWADG